MLQTYSRCLPLSTNTVKDLVARLTSPGMYAAARGYFAAELEGQKDEALEPTQ